MSVDTNLTPTQANNGEHRRHRFRLNMLTCRYFRTSANNRELLMLPSHGRGHEFESRRVHSVKLLVCRCILEYAPKPVSI
jgi:hypothetical protein